MAGLQQRHNKWRAKVRIPKDLEAHYGGRKVAERTLTALDRASAKIESAAWEAALRLEWAEARGQSSPSRDTLRQIYASLMEKALGGEFLVHVSGEDDPVAAGIDFELSRMADAVGERDLTDAEAARVAALQDAIKRREGRPVERRPELELSFRELADTYMDSWRAQHGLKVTNTDQQKIATFDLFALYWGARPLREVRKADAAAFVDALRRLDPLWGRSPKARDRDLTWLELMTEFGSRPKGLSDATMNRHLATLSSFWRWGQERDHCEGNNPFTGFHRRLRDGRNVKGYQAWEPDELRQLFNPPPKRDDVLEVMWVAMFTGMRLDEIASLTRQQIKTETGVTFVNVIDAKTEAGVRRVPLHPRLKWLADRAEGEPAERIWPRFNLEGPGKKAGADAGKEFSRFKLAKGFDSRRKAFHSFRKNFVGQLEEVGVPQSEVAQLVGHEKGFTFGKYSPKGLSLGRLAKIVAMIDYPGLSLPAPGKGSA